MFARKVLTLCKGNICRSPIAEAVLQDIINKAGVTREWFVDSAGMDDEWEGHPPDPRAVKLMKKYNLLYSNTSRPLIKDDFYKFEYILGMDEANMKFLDKNQPTDSKTKCFLLGDFGLPENQKYIRDPYYDDHEKGFEEAYQQCLIACPAFFEQASANRI